MIRIVTLVAVALIAAIGGPASASEKKAAPAAGANGIDLRPVAMPVIVDGRVLNYVFVTVRLMPTPTADLSKLRDTEQFYRDMLVRAAHRTPFTLAYDYNKVDEAKVIAAVMAATPAIAGRGQVKSAEVTKQLPKNTRASPRPPVAPPK